MRMNEVIYKYRKEAGLTQEQIANCLGVTPPAVNKWEKGASYPDITLLPSLARILKIDVNTLLCFQEELTDVEVSQFVQEVSDMASEQGFKPAFYRGETLIREYPRCDMLILSIAQILNVFLITQSVENAAEYEKKIVGWYELIADSQDQKLASMAMVSLVSKYMEKEEYEKAQNLLDKIPPLGYDKRISQATLFFRQNQEEKGYEIYEQMIYSSALQINSILLCILEKAIQKQDYNMAEKYGNIIKENVKLFELGAYMENTPDFYIALAKEDKDSCLAALEKMLSAMDSLYVNTESSLYSHIRVEDNMQNTKSMMRDFLKKGLEKDKELDILRGEKRFQRLMREL